MNPSRSTSLAMTSWRWASEHRGTWAVISGIAWGTVAALIWRDVLIAAVCGVAFALVSSVSLPEPPAPVANDAEPPS